MYILLYKCLIFPKHSRCDWSLILIYKLMFYLNFGAHTRRGTDWREYRGKLRGGEINWKLTIFMHSCTTDKKKQLHPNTVQYLFFVIEYHYFFLIMIQNPIIMTDYVTTFLFHSRCYDMMSISEIFLFPVSFFFTRKDKEGHYLQLHFLHD